MRMLMMLTTALALVLVPLAAMAAVHAPAIAADAPAATEEAAPMVFDSPPPVGAKATCPVMKHSFTITEKTLRSEYKGKHVAFCCPGCKPKFDADPEKYLPKKGS